IGLPIIECPEAVADAENGDEIGMDFDSGVIVNYTKNKQYKAAAFPPFIQAIIEKGGLVEAVNANIFGGKE
ncbi:MAG TPA: 3-isopropylmalate dehydratase small subunit, partial [Clostridiales bacterium]|nr:3-isopropylmalate dehydratase small subunit [Clostridiales bacterium]